MSDSMPTPHPTREQLDELETLMQRMLALPVNQLDADSGDNADTSLPRVPTIHVPPEWETSSAILPGPAVQQAPKETATDEPQDDPAPHLPAIVALPSVRERAREPRASDHDEFANLGPWPVTRGPAKRAEENGGAVAANVVIVDRPATAPQPWKPLRARRRRSVWVRPLEVVNWAFDRCTMPLGSFGRWLRGPNGRSWIGWTGLLFLTTAAVWAVLGCVGWTW
jgi:hypothetical protein